MDNSSNNNAIMAMVMAMKKINLQNENLSLSQTIQQLKNSGFSDEEVVKILGACSPEQPQSSVGSEDYNEQVDHVISFAKKDVFYKVISLVIFFCIILLPARPDNIIPFAMSWAVFCVVTLAIRSYFFSFKNANYFLKK
ncbi:hypothetical protein [Photobacterium sp. R1]